jgi:Ca2+-binding EF-hand superfamily protein
MWKVHFRVEVAAEIVRQRLQGITNFNVYDAFNSLDLNNDGIITTSELRRIMESRGFYISENEANKVIAKFDTKKDGTIRFNEVSHY